MVFKMVCKEYSVPNHQDEKTIVAQFELPVMDMALGDLDKPRAAGRLS
jgi:hypothetical protein